MIATDVQMVPFQEVLLTLCASVPLQKQWHPSLLLLSRSWSHLVPLSRDPDEELEHRTSVTVKNTISILVFTHLNTAIQFLNFILCIKI